MTNGVSVLQKKMDTFMMLKLWIITRRKLWLTISKHQQWVKS